MSGNGVIQIVLYLVVLLALCKPLGLFMAAVYEGRRTWLDPFFKPVERFIYWLCGLKESEEMAWTTYAAAMLIFSVVSVLAMYGIQRVQASLPLNPAGLSNPSPDLSFNTATSFATNTNWQSYGGEVTLSYFTQMVALTVQNFVSAAAGMAMLVALIRGIVRKQASSIGNFWVDLTRSTLYILLPMSIVFALLLVSQGVIQNFSPYKPVALVQKAGYDDPQKDDAGNPVLDANKQPVTKHVGVTEQMLPMGPAASQIAIKQLGTNGGGFFNTNSAHPFENPTPFTNFLEAIAILLIPGALCCTFGKMVGDMRQGWAILAAMTIVLVAGIFCCYWAEATGNPKLAVLGVDQQSTDTNPGGNFEGKETRFGVANSALWATATTGASNGSVNSMHDSYTPLGGLVPLVMIKFGEVIYGGVGSGLYGMLAFVFIAVFIAGLMVGRTPEYLGKKIEAYEVKMASLVVLIMPAIVLSFLAVAVVTDAGLSAPLAGQGPAHTFSEMLYAFASMGNNNGSAFGGLTCNSFYNSWGGVAMLISRFWLAIPILAIAGSLAKKKVVPVGPGTLATHTPLFVSLLIGTLVIVAALTFIPALALGPIVEHLQLFGG